MAQINLHLNQNHLKSIRKSVNQQCVEDFKHFFIKKIARADFVTYSTDTDTRIIKSKNTENNSIVDSEQHKLFSYLAKNNLNINSNID